MGLGNWEPFLGKTRDVSDTVPEKSKDLQLMPKIECELCGGNHKVEQCPHERKFSLGLDATSSDTKDRLLQTTMETALNMEASPVNYWNNKPHGILPC